MCDLLKQVAQPHSDDITFIYALVDPITEYVRYVGKANKPDYRLKMHLTPAELSDTSHKNSWLKSLLSKGEKPNLIILESTSKSSWQEAERRWISHYRSIADYPILTNTTDGGEGVSGLILSAEARKKRSESRIGYKMSDTAKEKIGNAHKGRKHTPQSKENMSNGKNKFWNNLPQESKEKIIQNLRQPLREETREKMRESAWKVPLRPNGTSIYRGVQRVKTKNPWRAFACIDGKPKHIRVFASEEEAAIARDRFVIKYIGERAPLNFPRSNYVEEFPIPSCLPERQE